MWSGVNTDNKITQSFSLNIKFELKQNGVSTFQCSDGRGLIPDTKMDMELAPIM